MTIPDHPSGERWCKSCNCFLNVEEFPVGAKRFECRIHRRPRSKIQRTKMFKDASKLGVWRMWHRVYLDSKAVFGHQRLGILQEDIKKFCIEAGTEPSTELRVVPTDPLQQISVQNISLVNKIDRIMLAKVWKLSKDPDRYKAVLKQWQSES